MPERLIPLDDALGATLDAVSAAINERACDELDAAVKHIAEISGGAITPTEEQRAAISSVETAKLRDQYVQQVKDLSRAFVASIGEASPF